MNDWLQGLAESSLKMAVGWPAINEDQEIKKGIAIYRLMESVLKTTSPSKRCQDCSDEIKFLIDKHNLFDLQDARILLENCPKHFIDGCTLIVPDEETLDEVENYVFQSDKMYIKVTKDMGNMTILRECFIGIMCLNHLRTYIPNFAYILGFWKYQRPIGYRIPNGRYDHVYTNDPRLMSDYVSYEEIRGITLNEYIKLFRGKGLKNILWQVCNAIKLAYQMCRFYHMDLHTSNIIITTRDYRYTYFEEGYTKFFDTNIIATIIDYGRSACTYQDSEYSKWWELEEDDSLYNDKHVIYPIRDMMFLLCSIITHHLKHLDSDALEMVKKLNTYSEASSSMADLDILLLKLSPDCRECISPHVEVSPIRRINNETEVQKTFRYIDQLTELKELISTGEENIIAYGASLLGILSSEIYKPDMIRKSKETIRRYLALLDGMDHNCQRIYDLYINLSNYL